MNLNKWILLIAFIVFSSCAIFNNGFYHYDEHYQIIEFAELKTGNNSPQDLAWEYFAKIRSTLQPAIAYILLTALRAVHLTDPYYLMIALRLITAIISLITISYFFKKTQAQVGDKFKTLYVLLTYFLWFLPFIYVRFSSENYSGLAFMLSIAVFFSNTKNKYVLMGGLFGLSFLFRYQTAFMSLGFIVWLILVHKVTLKTLLNIIVMGGLVVLAGLLIDYWFYGAPAITFYNYFTQNITNDVASGYGVQPWYFYFKGVLTAAVAPIGILILLGLLIQVIYYPKAYITWIVLPFLIVHIIIPHKELRFLFPMAGLLPFIITSSSQQLTMLSNRLIRKQEIIDITYMILVSVLAVVNLFSLATIMFSPGDSEGRINITQKIHKEYKDKAVTLWVTGNDNPYHPIPVNQKFYLDKNIKCTVFNDSTFKSLNFRNVNLLVIKDDQLEDYQNVMYAYDLKKVVEGVPKWIVQAKSVIGFHTPTLLLYEIRPKN